MYGKGCFGSFYLNKGLRWGETAYYASYFYTISFETFAYYFSKVGVYADSGKRGKVGVFVGKFVYVLGKLENAFLWIGFFKRGEFNSCQKLFEYFGIVVFCTVLSNEGMYFFAYLLIVEIEVVLAECLFIFIRHCVGAIDF